MLTSVEDATRIVLENCIDYGSETIAFERSVHRILAESIVADRDLPPFDRVTMDGVAIAWQSYEAGQRYFKIESTQTAGEAKHTLQNSENCIEVMTGAVMPNGTDLVIRYEDLEIIDGVVQVMANIRSNQNVHYQGEDRKAGQVILPVNTLIGPPEVAIAASVGATQIHVRKLSLPLAMN
jgi:molybdopterin molybdotransferase